MTVYVHSRTTGIDTFTGEEYFFSGTGPPGLIVDLEAIDHVLEINIFRIVYVEVTRSEDVTNGAVQRGKSIHGIRRLEQRVWGL